MKKTVNLPANVFKHEICETQDDFYKFLFVIARSNSDSSEEMEYNVFGLRLLLHEYAALILNGEMDPYQLPKFVVENESRSFRDLIHSVNEEMAELGVPMKEGEGGKMEFDYEEIHRVSNEIRRNRGKA